MPGNAERLGWKERRGGVPHPHWVAIISALTCTYVCTHAAPAHTTAAAAHPLVSALAPRRASASVARLAGSGTGRVARCTQGPAASIGSYTGAFAQHIAIALLCTALEWHTDNAYLAESMCRFLHRKGHGGEQPAGAGGRRQVVTSPTGAVEQSRRSTAVQSPAVANLRRAHGNGQTAAMCMQSACKVRRTSNTFAVGATGGALVGIYACGRTGVCVALLARAGTGWAA